MSEKRKDNKGRILRTGESQRPDNTYQYRYTDLRHNRRYVYAKTLDDLRKKETAIQRDLADGIDTAGGEITVNELVARYLSIKRGLRRNSLRAYNAAAQQIKNCTFGEKKINSVKLSDAKAWFVSLHDGGYRANTIGVIQNLVRPAFEMAVDDDLIRKNPFKFKLSDVLKSDAQKRPALTKKQQREYLSFIKHYGNGCYYEDIVILLGTGLRVSELYGLTKADVDMTQKCIHVRRQLCRTAERPYFITPPKTESGRRTVPMTDTVYEAFRSVIAKRGKPKVEMIVDGVSGFLFLDKMDKPKVAMHLENYMRSALKYYRENYGNNLPSVTPHVLRHTFCTNAQQADLDVKSLQYIMGHSNVSVTLDVYTHSDYASAKKSI